MMGNIYRNAASVLAFVGQSPDDSPRLFRVLNQHATDLIRCSKRWRETEAVDHFFRQRLTHRKLGLNSTRNFEILIRAFEPFMSRPYFTRVWVIQELFMGEDVIVCCGQDVALVQALDGLRIVICQLICRKMFPGEWSDPKLVLQLSNLTRSEDLDLAHLLESKAFAQRHMEAASGSKTRLLALGKAAELTLGLECSDPRDKVYAFSALVDWGEVSPVEPDYNISVFDLALQTLYKLAELELLNVSPQWHDPRVLLIPALGLSAQTLEIAEALRKRQCSSHENRHAGTPTETSSRLKKHSMFWLAWDIVYEESHGWRLKFKKPALLDPTVDKTVQHNTPPEIHTRLRDKQVSVFLPPCVQCGDVLLIQGRFSASLGSEEWLGLVARLDDTSDEPYRHSIVGKAIVQGDLFAALKFRGGINLGMVFFDPEDSLVHTAAELQHPSWEEASKADRELYLKTRVCRTPGSSYAIAGSMVEYPKLFHREIGRLSGNRPADIPSKETGKARPTMRGIFVAFLGRLYTAVFRLVHS
ncbi:hypothetical protein LX32DRAFT_729048 [Colletotrichum zoysiae]|uniref:Heterokaryon incompatibility domain-containing protein n=1 Tax=Colletotrichum zoysiae TaxID=1216348 RepID=A0AAD9M462_9PEZI|nr:hypothetical protein LX32DRAFT_729048 [Colletotrichum zoysiae]